MPCVRIAPVCSVLARIASKPPCTFGCSVFTRPSIISGKPVSSDTSITGNPASAIALAVPPVETISTPCAASALAKSIRPVLLGHGNQRAFDAARGIGHISHYLSSGVSNHATPLIPARRAHLKRTCSRGPILPAGRAAINAPLTAAILARSATCGFWQRRWSCGRLDACAA